MTSHTVIDVMTLLALTAPTSSIKTTATKEN
jgi:hypothetical protein